MTNPPLKIKPPQIQWSPLATMGLAASTGSYVGSIHTPTNESALLAACFTITTIVIGLFFLDTKRKSICIASCLFLLLLSKSTYQLPVPPWALLLRNDLCELDCTVISTPDYSIRTKGPMVMFDHREPATWFYATATLPGGKSTKSLKTSVHIKGKHSIKLGDTHRCIGWLRESSKQRDQYTFYTTNQPDHNNSRDQKEPKVFEQLTNNTNTIKQNIQTALTSNLLEKERTLANALFLGIRDTGWNTMSDQFRRAGMSHLLAISGLHVGLFLCVVATLFAKKSAGIVWNITIACVAILFIGTVVELRAPVIRALTMAVIISSLKTVGIRCSSSGLLGLAAILFLLINPRDAGTITFQLTFLVVAALCVLLPQIQWKLLGPSDPNGKIINLSLRWLVFLWLTGICAWCIATPITAHVFGTVSPSGILSSAPSVLVLFVTIVLGLLKTIAAYITIFPQDPTVLLFSTSLDAMLLIATTFGKLPMAFITNVTMSWLQAFSIIVWIVGWSLLAKKRAIVWAALPIVVCLLCINDPNNTTTITTMNVGHGTCHIIQHGGHTILVDAGSRSNFDIGARVIVPKLRALGTATIHSIFITHADLDHLVGIIDVIQRYQTEKIIIAPQTLKHTTPLLEHIIKEAQQKNIQISSGSSGWTEHIGDMTISIISPEKNAPYFSSNAASIVLRLQVSGRTLLFTGDIDETRIEQLLRADIGDTDVIELPHHGQWSKESQKLINKIAPLAVIQSTNKLRHAKDRWSIPDNTVRFVTAVDGDITTSISRSGEISISGSNAPATMLPCVLSN